jgi:hypothetical protein
MPARQQCVHGNSVEDAVQFNCFGHAGSARTFACRVRTLANTFLTNSERSHECERGTQKCVRYGVFITHGNFLT